MTKDKALHKFFDGFGIPAYVDTSVPVDATFPYLTYSPVFDFWGDKVSLTINLWFNTESESIPNEKAQEISSVLAGGKYIACDNGAILLTRGTPFVSSLSDDKNKKIKRRYINITAEYLTLY